MNTWLEDHIDSEERHCQGLNKLKPETRLQIGIMHWLNIKYPELSPLVLVSAGGLFTSPKQASLMKSMGYKPGTPDLFFAFCRQGYHGFFLELKEKAKVSDKQEELMVLLREQGFCAMASRGWKSSLQAIEDYIHEDVSFDYYDIKNTRVKPQLPGARSNLTEKQKDIQASIFTGIKNAKATAHSKAYWKTRK